MSYTRINFVIFNYVFFRCNKHMIVFAYIIYLTPVILLFIYDLFTLSFKGNF